ncbi:BspA family leucine-rich repeat surface protein [Flagellimonas onchidii]|uniref:BspA family leucine-rich repeat surface protein n=1 Tax=Flagellimonas onchidii TaxID=2562684 RepID=UPI0010A64A27|nr:BspA family leucine-rich repeat surface protein [Allomuricauda onchidii]
MRNKLKLRHRAPSSAIERHRAPSSAIERHRAPSSAIERKTLKRSLLLALLLIGAISCSKKEDPVPPTNSEPKIDQSTLIFDTNENIPDTDVIGTLKATDADGDELKFSMVANSEDLFEVVKTNEGGAISLAAGKSFDIHEESKTFEITIGVSDDNNPTVNAQVTINVGNVNKAPEITADQVFEVAENVEGAEVGTVDATDPDGDTLEFEIVTDITDPANGLFVIDKATGILSLDEGKTLDFEGTPSYILTVIVTDGAATTEAEITINVVDDGVLAESPDSFVTTWTTDGQGVEIQLNSEISDNNLEGLTFDYVIDWGDGSEVEELTTAKPIHVYEEPGAYTVAITGQFPALRVSGYEDYFTSMEQWGNIQWRVLEKAFVLTSMDYNATDSPDLSMVKDISSMFSTSSVNFKTSIANWDVSKIEDMNSMFYLNEGFNDDISGWDVSSVIYMNSMFHSTTVFNQPIGAWGEKTSNVIDMSSMFKDAKAFDQNLGGWDISSAQFMENMLDNPGLSRDNYGATLLGWATMEVQLNVTLGAAGLDYCNNNPDILAARETLSNNNWTFIGDLGVFCIGF